MKIKWKRIAALALTGAMCLSLFGCGDKEETAEETKTLAQELGYGYLSEYSKLETDMDYIQNVSSAQGKLYLQGYYYDEENYENSGDRLYAMDMSTGETSQVPLPELVHTDSADENVQSIFVCPDGSGYWMVTSTYVWSYVEDVGTDGIAVEEALPEEAESEAETLPAEEGEAGDPETLPAEEGQQPTEAEGLSAEYQLDLLSDEVPVVEAPAGEAPVEESGEEVPAEEEAGSEEEIMPIDEWVYQEPEQTYTAQKCDFSGNVLQEIDLTEAVSDMEWFYCQAIAQTGSGELLIASDSVILRFGADGQRKDDIPVDTFYIQAMTAAGDGTVVISYYNSETYEIEICRVEDGGLSEPLELTGAETDGVNYLYTGDGSKVLLNDGKKLYELDTATGAVAPLLNWLDSDINGNRVSGVLADGGDAILVLLEQYSRNTSTTYELGTLTKTPVDQIPERTIMTLGAEYLDDLLQNAVIDFNRKSDTYRITMVDYSAYNTEEDYTLGAKQLDMDVISGNSPDLISLSSGNVEKYMGKGVLADMTALMEQDGSITMDDLLSGPLQAYMQDGKLYGMPYYFGLTTLYGSARLLGDRESWTLEEMGQVIDGLDEDTTIMTYTTRADFLASMVYQNMSRFVDYGNASCAFDSDEFKELLAVSAKLPEDYNYGSEGDVIAVSSYDEMEMLQAGDALVVGWYISGSYDLKNFYSLYVRENGIVNIGYPTDSGNGALLDVYGGLAISDKCANKEGAWEFVKTILSDDFQTEQWNLPVTVSAMDQLLAEAMEQDYYMDGDEKVYIESSAYIGNTEYPVKELTQEQVEDFKEYINNAAVSGRYDSDIMEIVSEEAAAYFAGDKSADEVAKLIQNRVSIYLGETS